MRQRKLGRRGVSFALTELWKIIGLMVCKAHRLAQCTPKAHRRGGRRGNGRDMEKGAHSTNGVHRSSGNTIKFGKSQVMKLRQMAGDILANSVI